MIRSNQGSDDSFTVEQFTDDIEKGFAARLIRKKVYQLTRICRGEADDVRQDFHLQLIQRWGRFRPERAHWNIFAKTLIERHAATIARRMRTNKRRFARTTASLDAPAQSADGSCTVGDCVSDDRGAGHIGRYKRCFVEIADMRIDVKAILRKVPAEDRLLCGLLMHYDITATARILGIPRTSLRRRIAKLKRLFKS